MEQQRDKIYDILCDSPPDRKCFQVRIETSTFHFVCLLRSWDLGQDVHARITCLRQGMSAPFHLCHTTLLHDSPLGVLCDSDDSSVAIVVSQAALVTLTVFAGGQFRPFNEVRAVRRAIYQVYSKIARGLPVLPQC